MNFVVVVVLFLTLVFRLGLEVDDNVLIYVCIYLTVDT